jgi:hypothetical protein
MMPVSTLTSLSWSKALSFDLFMRSIISFIIL